MPDNACSVVSAVEEVQMSKYLDDIWDEVGDPDEYVTRSSGVYEALDRLDEVLKAIVKERDKAQQLLAAYQEEIRPGQYCCSKCGNVGWY